MDLADGHVAALRVRLRVLRCAALTGRQFTPVGAHVFNLGVGTPVSVMQVRVCGPG